jgi:hypothetical protein
MKTIKLLRRLEALEQQLTSEPIILLMPDGRTETLRGDVLDFCFPQRSDHAAQASRNGSAR